MKQEQQVHIQKSKDALSYYLQVQREYALAREGYLRIDEADDTYNDLNRKIIDAYRERYGAAYLGRINYSGNQRQRIADGTESVFEAYTGQPLYNFSSTPSMPKNITTVWTILIFSLYAGNWI